MPEVKNITFEHKEIAEILVKHLDLHEGLWGIYFELALGGANVPTSPDQTNVMPAAIAMIQRAGIQRFEAENNLTVDAAKVNPATK